MLSGHRWRIGGDYAALVEAAFYFVGFWGALNLIRWFVRNVELSSGEKFFFHGSYSDLVGLVTVIGRAWVLAAMGRWAARETRGSETRLRFHAGGGDLLGYTVAAFCFTLMNLTIPWGWSWYTKFLVRSTTLEPALTDVTVD